MTILLIILGATAVLVLLFTTLLLVQYKLGFDNSLRDEAGNLDSRRSPVGLLLSLLVFTMLIGVPIVAIGIAETTVAQFSFGQMWSLAYAIFFLANLYDLVVLDYILVVKHRPSFITGLPDTPYYTTMKPHVQGFARALVIGVITSLVSALLAQLF